MLAYKWLRSKVTAAQILRELVESLSSTQYQRLMRYGLFNVGRDEK